MTIVNVGSILEIEEGRYLDEFKIARSGTFLAGQWTTAGVAGALKTTITLDSGANNLDNYYTGMFIHIIGGGGYEPKILSYNGTTKVAELGVWTGSSYNSAVAFSGASNTPAVGKQWQIISDFPIYREFSWVKDGVDIPEAIGTSYTPSQPGSYQVKEIAAFPTLVNKNDQFGPWKFGPFETTISDPITVTGTRDTALVYQEDLQYLGCFIPPEWTTAADGSQSFNVGYAFTGVMTFNSAGNNGEGSIFMRTHAYDQRVGEFTIPPQNTWATTSTQGFPQATFIQTPRDAIEGQLRTSGIIGGGGITLSGIHIQGNYLYVAAHEVYDTGNGGSTSWVWRRPLNLSAAGTVEGPYNVCDLVKESGVGAQWSQQGNPRRFAGYFASVPVSLQVKLGGEMILGCSAQSIVGNTSDGPAIASIPSLTNFDGKTGRRGTVIANGFSNNTITFDVDASSANDFYIGWSVLVRNNTVPNKTGERKIIAYNGLTKVATVSSNWNTNPAVGDQWLLAPHIEATAMAMYGSGQLQTLGNKYAGMSPATVAAIQGAGGETYKYQGVFNWTCRSMGGYAIPDGTRSVLVFGKGGNGLYKYTIGGMCADGVIYFDVSGNGGTPGERASPYYARCWAYDANELEQARLGNVAVNNVKPYAVINFIFPFAGAIITGVTYDPTRRRLYLATNGRSFGGVVIHVYEVTNAVAV
jgi:hypothetical protein